MLICLSLWHMAHGTVTFTCYNHKIGVVILHKVNIWQVVEELWHFNFQMACLKHIIWSNCNRHLWRNPYPRGFAGAHTIYIYKSRLYVKLMFWFFTLLWCTWYRNWKILNNMFSVLKLVKDFRKERHESVVGETYI